MACTFETLAEFLDHSFDDLIDVRSPAEFAEDHIPGAINLPALDDGERARVGTIYSQQDPFTAKKIGAALVARNAASHLDGPLKDKDGSWRPLVYCWRGGQRSGSFASILQQIGWRAETVAGGYQTYRRMVARVLHEDPLGHRLIILEGNTGTAKTELLHLLDGRGHQTLDLEGLANHRGSVFGATGVQQPSQKMFEGLIAAALLDHDLSRPVIVEAESSKIGRLIIPPSLWSVMKTAPRIRLLAELPERSKFLTRAYSDIISDRQQITDRLSALIPHQGRERVTDWQNMVADGALDQLAKELMQFHYDPSYERSRAAHANQVSASLTLPSLSENGLAASVADLEILINGLADP